MLLSFSDLPGWENPYKNAPKKKRRKGKKKNPFRHWLENCTVLELKTICKAAKLPVSGTKIVLRQRLHRETITGSLVEMSLPGVKLQLKQQGLVQSGNKCDGIVRLLHAQLGTGEEANKKRSSNTTATATDAAPAGAGTATQPPKKVSNKTTPSPKMMYTRVKQKMHAVAQKKYQTHYGSKNHAPDVYYLMKQFVKNHALDQVMTENPKLAEEMARSVFQAFYDNWHVMQRVGYETQDFRDSVDYYGQILTAVRPQLTAAEMNDIMSLLESIETSVRGHDLHKRLDSDPCVFYSTGEGTKESLFSIGETYDYKNNARYEGENVLEQTIRIVMPHYNKESGNAKGGNHHLQGAMLEGMVLTSNDIF